MASAYERKGSPFYWIKVRLGDGTWKAMSSGIRVGSEGAVRKLQRRLGEEAAKEQRQTSDGADALFRSWVAGWIVHHYQNENSVKRAKNAWAHLSAYFKVRGVIHPEEVTYGLCHDYMKWRTDEAACEDEGRRLGNWNTALTELRMLGTIMQEAVARSWVLANPCSRLRLGRRKPKEKREVTLEEQEIIEEKLKELPAKEAWIAEIWQIGIKQGCRLSEVQVPMDRVDTQNMVITFKIKGGEFHAAPLHASLLPLVLKAREEKREVLVPLPDNASKKFVNFMRKCGVEDLSYHCLRVTVVTRLARAGVSESKAMKYVGHCDEMVHAIYRKLRPKDVAALGQFL